jgi:hypothetical protein
MNRFLHYAVFVVGLIAVCWVGAGYVGSHPLALTVTVLVGGFYLMGGLELHRFHQATTTLARAVADLSAPPASLAAWLEQLPSSLRNAVRLRIEGERIGLPGPALTPYLAGFLVLLGMLGTFLGMVVALNGTGMALDSATDLQSVRASLSAPVKGLGLAFGTSLAGVAASAMLGLASALCRRERLQAGQMLDTKIATTLRAYSQAHQREESFKLLQQQTHGMPELVGQLQAMMATMERQSQALNERLISSQDHFHSKAEMVYAGLASSVDQSLKQSLTESARIAGATIQPVVEATMAGIARETASLHDTVAHTVQLQLDGLSSRFEATTTRVADTWKAALTEHQRTSEALSQDLRSSHDRFAETFEQRSAALVESVSTRLESTVGSVDQAHARLQAEMASRDEQRLSAWTQSLAQAARDMSAQTEAHAKSTTAEIARLLQAASEAPRAAAEVVAELRQKLSDSMARDNAMLEERAHILETLQTETASRDAQRLSVWTQSLASMAASLQQEWQQAGAHAAGQQQQLFETLAQTARDMSAQTEAHAKNTVAEIAGLLQTAAEAPRAAAEVVAELRQKLSDSMARDNTMLEERARILETLGTLLGAVNHASTEQRAAVDALVGASADVLERVGSRFTEKVESETGRMADVAAQITGSAVEVASLGETFGFAVQLFSESNDKLVAHLQRIEGALGKSIARSDEQLEYYVAQAREVIDLSIMSQKQIVEDLQQIAGQQRTPVGSEA